MGEGTPRVVVPPPAPAPDKQARAIEGEIDTIRTRLDRSLAELDRRRHELTDVQLQIRKHPMVLAVAGGAALLFVGGLAYSIYSARKRANAVPTPEELAAYRSAGRRVLRHPDRVAKGDPSVGEKILGAIGTTVATMVAKKLIERAFDAAGQRER